MDPNATLQRIRSLSNTWEEWGSLELDPLATLDELTELMLGLDEWLTSGGFRPNDWS